MAWQPICPEPYDMSGWKRHLSEMMERLLKKLPCYPPKPQPTDPE